MSRVPVGLCPVVHADAGAHWMIRLRRSVYMFVCTPHIVSCIRQGWLCNLYPGVMRLCPRPMLICLAFLDLHSTAWSHTHGSLRTSMIKSRASVKALLECSQHSLNHHASLSPARVEPLRRSLRRRCSSIRLLDRLTFRPSHCRCAMSLHPTSRAPAVKMNHLC